MQPDEFDDFGDEFDNNHPLDNFFNAESTLIDMTDDDVVDVQSELYDVKDNSLDEELSQLAALAKKTFHEQKDAAMRVEPKFRAELLGVANNLLNTTLAAISKKADMKIKKDVVLSRSKKISINNSENTNIIVADRNELLKLRKQK